MAHIYDGAGGLFTRFGKLAGYLKTLRTLQRTTMPAEVDDVLGAFSTADQDCVAKLLSSLDSHRSGLSPAAAEIVACATMAFVEQVHAETPLATKTIGAAMEVIRVAMAVAAEDIDAPTVSGSAGSCVGTGNGAMVVSTSDERGNTIQHLRAEVIRVTCLTDSQDGATTAGIEQWRAVGQAAVPNTHWDWPAGSGLNAPMQTSSPSVNGGYGRAVNLLRNSDFEVVTANKPDYWTADVGTAGTHFDDQTTAVHRGAKSLEFIGDGATLTALSQTFNSATATPGILRPKTKMATSFWLRHDGVAPAAGVLRVSVRDSGGSEIGGSAVSVTLSGISSSWVHYSLAWATPFPVPTGAKAVIELTTALTAGRSIYIDDLVIAEMDRPDPYGAFMLIVPGSTEFSIDDYFDVTISNNRAAGVAAEMCLELDRFFDLYSKKLYLPVDTGGAETIADSLIS